MKWSHYYTNKHSKGKFVVSIDTVENRMWVAIKNLRENKGPDTRCRLLDN